MRLSFLIISLLLRGVIASSIINYRDLADRRLCNNVGSDGYMCKVRREPNLEGGGDIPCDNRKLRPEQCQEVIIETLHSALSEVFAGLPELDTNLNVRRIAITLTGNNTHDSEAVDIVRGDKRRRLHKAFLRYHDPNNWPLLREALKAMGRADLIGNGKHHLIPTFQPMTDGSYQSARRKNSTPVGKAVQPVAGRLLTQHTGLPPRVTGAGRPGSPVGAGKRKPR